MVLYIDVGWGGLPFYTEKNRSIFFFRYCNDSMRVYNSPKQRGEIPYF